MKGQPVIGRLNVIRRLCGDGVVIEVIVHIGQDRRLRRHGRLRNQSLGFVFQHHHLLPQYSALENALVPTLAFPGADQQHRARDLLAAVGLDERLEHRPAELSGGECQRVAVARALINHPGLLLCDEPTGSLDRQTATTVADLLFDLHRAEDTLLVIVTHDPELAARCDRRLQLSEGLCVEA